MKEEFIKAVADGNVIKVRLSLSNELLLNPQSDEFGKMLEYAKQNIPDLYEEDIPGQIDMARAPETWDKKYLLEVKDALDLNFSEQKLGYYMVVVKTVEIDKVKGPEINVTHQEHHPRRRVVVKKAPAAAIGVGAAVGIVGLCLSKAVLASIGGALVVGGALLVIKDNLD